MTKQHIKILRCIIDNHSHDITVSDAREALQRKREYMENSPCPLKIVKKLERK